MSDNYSSSHYRKKATPTFGTGRKMKYFKITLVLFLAGIIAGGYFLMNSGALADTTSAIPGQVLSHINSERKAANLPAVTWNQDQANRAVEQSSQVRVSPLAQASHTTENSLTEDAYTYPRVSQALSAFSIQQPLFDSWSADQNAFRGDVLNPNFKTVGIGADSDGYNYYIVAVWK